MPLLDDEGSRTIVAPMHVVVTGATGNVGTSVVASLAADPRVTTILGIARRGPSWRVPKTSWIKADVACDDLIGRFRGADAVIHLAWRIQPSHREDVLHRTNVAGSARVFDAVAEAGVPALVYASSVGAYRPAPKDRFVDESWPVVGIATSSYSRHKAEVEALLDAFEERNAGVRVVRLRPSVIFKREAGAEIRRLFLGPFFPNALLRPGLVPFFPDIAAMRFQAVHSHDVGDAYRLAALGTARGTFNISAEPVLDGPAIAELLSTRPVSIPAAPLRLAAWSSWQLRLQPTDVGWIDVATQSPLIECGRAARELGWTATRTAIDALKEMLEGIRDGTGMPTPPLLPGSHGPLRLWELTTGVGSREAA
jgi:nucleoside-diphosphate-sugar epimerase